MIGDEGVPFVDLGGGIVFEHPLGTGGEGPHVKRQHDVLGDHLTLTVQNSAACVLGLSDDGGEAGAEKRVLHFLHDACQARLDHLQSYRVNAHIKVLSFEFLVLSCNPNSKPETPNSKLFLMPLAF
jgi:hypothetical protein